ncbi:cell division protein FtsQ/DivIB [Bifidobacterium platyrrhinorum]|uniref:FtsQ-type POTRA domain-containing protein n=1 Tax=Bifidobacterium platyrrhinorum TaxID=2661628 RepID=A0A6L9SPD4_9BIFI|nr:FtsQ-type POTRA domain-containing protein [Bifidobacterium platyrrhinorum]NEG54387.1 FtsQ-type POTRA domain-containing protein [Bifidobacterium platyrrhinorum]
MAGRVVRSDGPAPAGGGNARSASSGLVRSAKGTAARKPAKPAGASASATRAGRKGRVVEGSAAARAARERKPVSRSEPGQFVDARRLASEDLVARTLEENTGTLGLATRPKVVDFTARARERKRVGARIVVLRVLAGVLAAVSAIGLGWLLFLSPVLRLESSQVTVTGANEWVSETQIRSIVGEQTGRSLLLVDTNAMTEKMGSIPGVTSAEATKRYPHGLQVAIKAQRPAAMLKEKGSDSLTAVDAKARVLNSVAGASAEGVPVIEVGDVDRGLKSRAVKETLQVLDALPESLRTKITKVTAGTQDSVTTELDGGAHVVVWGDSSDMKLKSAVVDKILSDPNVIGDKTQVDVSAPLRPVLR